MNPSNITYYHSAENMYELKNNSIPLVVTSPPYPMIEKWDDLFGEVDFSYQHSILRKVWKELRRVVISGGIVCINIGDATRSIDGNFMCYPNFSKVVMDMYEIGFTPLIPIIWKKISNRPNAFLGSGFLPPNAYVSQDCEYIAIFRKRRLRKFPSKDKNRYDSQFTKEQRDKWFQQIWEIPGAKGAKEDSSFPFEIPERLIQMFSIQTDTVLDPFAGKGTTGLAANRRSRNFIGYEIK